MKTKIGRKLLPALLSLLLLIGLVPTAVLAAPNESPVAQIGTTPYDTLNDAFKAAAEMDTYNGEAVSRDNPVTIEILRDFTLDKTIWVKDSYSPYPPVDWHVKLTSANGEKYTITRDPEKVTGYMIQMDGSDSTVEGQYNSSLILENITLDGGATEESKETNSILLAYGWVELDDGAVLRNNKCNSSGGAINQVGKLILNDGCLIENNTTTNSGGGIYVWGECVMNGGIIRNNQTLGQYTYGGGVCMGSDASFAMSGGTITQNIAYRYGGGLYLAGTGVSLHGGSIAGNQQRTLSGKTSPDDAYGQSETTTLTVGGEIEIGYLVFSDPNCKIIVDSPLTNAINIDYGTGMKKGLVVVEKGDNYGDEDLDRSKFIFPTRNVLYCFWLTDGSEIKIDNHDGGTNTCTEGAKCSNCNKTYGEATGHSKTHYEAVAPTCTTDGNIEYWYCSNCEKYFSDEGCQTEISQADTVDEATGHSKTHYKAEAPTCTTDGSIEYWYCDVCEKYFRDEAMTQEIEKAQITVSAKGHGDTETANAKEATCTEEGYTGDQVCKDCGSVISKGKAIAKTEHTYKDGKCTVCGTADPNYKPESKPETKPEDKPTADIPQTGDNSNMTLWIVLLLASMGGVVGTTAYARKRRYNR